MNGSESSEGTPWGRDAPDALRKPGLCASRPWAPNHKIRQPNHSARKICSAFISFRMRKTYAVARHALPKVGYAAIRACRAAWAQAGHQRTPRVAVSRSIFAIVANLMAIEDKRIRHRKTAGDHHRQDQG